MADITSIFIEEENTTVVVTPQPTLVVETGQQGPQGIQGSQGLQGLTGPPGANTWGSITGTISNQSDLNSALTSKSDITHIHTAVEVGLGNVINAPQLQASNNLSDLPNKTTARTNLSVYSKAESDSSLANKADSGHSHTSNFITDFGEAVDDRVSSLLVAGSNITLSYVDGSQTLTISATGGSNYTSENAQDDIGTILLDSSTIDFTYNDTTPSITASVIESGLTLSNQSGTITDAQHASRGGGTLHAAATTSVSGFMASTDKTKLDGVATGSTANATNAELRDRTTHTGESPISSITSLQASLDAKEASITILPLAKGGTGSNVQNFVDLSTTQSIAGIKSFTNTTDTTSSNTGSVLVSGGMAIAKGLNLGTRSTAIAAPTGGNTLYSRTVSNKDIPAVMGVAGKENLILSNLAKGNVVVFTPANGTSYFSYGQYGTPQGTASHPLPADDTIPFMTNYLTAATAGSQGGNSTNSRVWVRGSTSSGFGGFFFYSRLYFPDATYASARVFIGMGSTGTTTLAASDTPAANYCGFQYSTNRADTTWQFTTSDGTTQSLVGITGASFLPQKVYEFSIYCPPGGSVIYFQLDNVTDGTTYSGFSSTNLPTSNIYLNAGYMLTTLDTTARNIRVHRLYVE